MEQVWVDPGRVIDAAGAVTAAAAGLDDVKLTAEEIVSQISASLVVVACGEGSRAAERVLGIVGERLRTWSASAEATLADVTRTDAATARALDGTGVDR